MTRAEVDLAIEWAAAEGWNPGLHDAQCFHATDPDGFLIAYLGSEPVGCISVVAYDDSFGFLGLYIVRPEFRGKGYGQQLWKAGMPYLGDRNVGLDGVVAQQENYKKSGFRLAYRNIRYGGIIDLSVIRDSEYGCSHPLPPGEGRGCSRGFVRHAPRLQNGIRLQADTRTASEGLSVLTVMHYGTLNSQAAMPPDMTALSAIPFDALCAYDSALFPAPRARFLREWITQPEAVGYAVLNDDGRLSGYGLLRPCRQGCKIGPLFADDAGIADRLLRTLSSRAQGSLLYLDVPETNPAAVMLAERYGMTKVFETARMYTKDAPTLPFEHLFGVTTFELG